MKRRVPAVLVPLLAAAAGAPATAQDGRVTLSGRVIGSGDGPVEGAIVELNSSRQVLTTREGAFRFTDVIAGPVHLHIEMIGYEPLDLDFTVTRDTVVELRLVEAPIVLDPLEVEARTISVRGRAVDPRTKLGVAGTVTAHPGAPKTSTNITGRYRLSNVPVTDSTFVGMYAFGYAAQQHHVESERNTVVDFVMVPDSVVVRIIQHMTSRLAERSDALGRPVRRGTYEEFNHAGTIIDVLRFQYQVRTYRCLIWNDDPDRRFWVVPMPHEVELIEIIGQRGTTADMVRIYTKEYFSRNIGNDAALAEISIRSRGSRARCQ